MLNELQRIFKETWGAFRSELGRREPEDEVAELLGMMRNEMAGARAHLAALEEAVGNAAIRLEQERASLADAERRGTMAERIGDQETVRIATEFAGRHRERVEILGAKLASVTAERDLQRRELEEMTDRYKAADRNRFGLVAEIRRRRAADAVSGETGAFKDFARMQEAVEQAAAEAEAAEELNEQGPSRADSQRPDLEDRLKELKRRMRNG
jgi:phage shock protein A